MFPQRRMQGELALTRIKNRPQMSARIVGIRQIGRHRPAVAIALFWLSGSRSEERGHSIVHRFRGRRHMHGIANVDLMVAVAGQVGRPWQARSHAGREPLAVVVMEPVCNLGQFYFLPTWSMVGAGFFLVTASTEIPNQLFEEGKVTIQHIISVVIGKQKPGIHQCMAKQKYVIGLPCRIFHRVAESRRIDIQPF